MHSVAQQKKDKTESFVMPAVATVLVQFIDCLWVEKLL